MEPLQLHIGKDNSAPRKTWLQRLGTGIVQRKLRHPFVIAALLFFAAFVSVLIAKSGPVMPLLVVVLTTALPAVYCMIVYPRFGIITMLVAAYFIMWFLRLGVNFPLGTVMDGMQAILLFGFFLKIKQKRDWQAFNNPVSLMIIVWIVYNLLQAYNPVAESRMAWLYTLRSVAILMLSYFIFLYNTRSIKFIRLIFTVWIALATFAAAYGCYQEFNGYFGFEWRWVQSDPDITNLYFIDGHWRKFAIFSDPVAFAYNMVASSVLCFCMSTGPIAKWKKTLLISLGIFQIIAMLFSGTRGAYVLLPAAMFLFCVLRFNMRILLFGSIAAVLIGALIVVPTGNPTLVRFQSAFKPSDDASFNLRTMNQKKIQPYIRTHPMGGGLGATGVWGQRFSPDSYLANFPPDSGYVRVAVELGWVGLLIFCTLMFTILRTGILNYFRIRDPELKSYSLAMVLIVFALNIGNYPQEALVQFPSNVYFYLEVALMSSLLLIDKEKHAGRPANT